LLEEIAHGGMGTVWRARQISLNRVIALKMVLAGRFANESEVKRFRAEAEAAAHLDHPHIVPIYEVGEHEGQHFFAMKLMEGGSLAEQLRSADAPSARTPGAAPRGRGVRAPSDVAKLLATVARAVHHAHQRGILHRDLKPGNILLDAAGEPHVTDFGLAKRFGVPPSGGSAAEEPAEAGTPNPLTLSGAVLGTPAYMSPEAASGKVKALTTASDIYSLGAILYELLAGRPPFTGESTVEVLRKVVEDEPVPPSRSANAPSARTARAPHADEASALHRPVDRDLETICLKCLEKDPARRYNSAASLADDLERFLRHEPIRARPSTPGERLVKWARRNPLRAGFSAALLGVTLLGVAGIAWQWRRAERHADAERASGQQAREQLWQSLVAQARAGRHSGRMGSKRAGLEALAAAARLRSAPELRDEIIAHLALFDLQPDPRPHRETNGVFEIGFDPDIEHCAFVDRAAGQLRIIRLADDTEVARWPLPKGAVGSPRFSPQGKYLTMPNGQDFAVFDPLTGRELSRALRVRRARFSPDDRTVAVITTDRRVRFFDASTGQALPHECVPKSTDDNLAWSPDGERLALTTGDTVEIWDWRRGERTERFRHDAAISRALAWAGEYVAAGDERGDILLWNTRTKKSRRFVGHQDHIQSVAFDPDGTILASTASDGTSRFWSSATGIQLLSTAEGFAHQFSRNGDCLGYRTVGGWGVWRVDAPRGFRTLSTGDQTAEMVSTAEVSRDGRVLLIANPGVGLQFVDLASGRVVLVERMNTVRAAWFLPDEKAILTSSQRQGLMVWPLQFSTNKAGDIAVALDEARVVPGVDWRGSDSVSLSADGRLAGTKISSREVVVLHLDDTSRVTRLMGEPEACRPAFSADRRWVVTASETGGGPCLWELDTGRFVRLLHAHPGNGGVQFSPDGRVLVTSDSTGVRFYDSATWTVTRNLPADYATSLAGHVAFTSDSRLVAFTIGRRALRLADAHTGKVLATLHSPDPRPINALRFNRDGRILAVSTASDAVDLWDIAVIQRELDQLGLGFDKVPSLGARTPRPRVAVRQVRADGASALLTLPACARVAGRSPPAATWRCPTPSPSPPSPGPPSPDCSRCSARPSESVLHPECNGRSNPPATTARCASSARSRSRR
jgi:serine/threonine protein kinase/WD40 repeat protein